MRTQLILQVHDELVMEGPREEIKEAVAVLREGMEATPVAAYRLRVPLVTSIAAGPNWRDMEEIEAR
jgi:DNA polymerase-1